jgi:hypothetical protein
LARATVASEQGETDVERRIDEALSSFVAGRLTVNDGDRYLSLALRQAD